MTPYDVGGTRDRNFSCAGVVRRPRERVTLSAALIVVVLCGVAAAQPAVTIDGDAPFTAEELSAALAVRVPDASRVEITSTAGGVIVSIGGSSRVVELGDARGEAAARLVALAASDLVLVDLATPPVSAPGAVAAKTGPDPTTVALTGGAASGWDGLLGGVTLHLTMPHGGWLIGVDAGGVTLVDSAFDLTGAVVRVGVGRRLGWLDVKVGAMAVPISVSEGAGDRTVLFGGSASAYLRVPVEGLHLVFGFGLDAFATRTEYEMTGLPAAATPWVAPWLEAGVELVP
jgi:hypothetical protein